MTIEEVKDFLSGIHPFKELDDAMLLKIAGGVIVEFYQQDTVIINEENPPCEYLQLIEKGKVKVCFRSGKEDKTEFRGKGNSFGCLRDKSGSRMHVAAVENTTCYLISKEILHKILEIHPSISEYFNPGKAAGRKNDY